MTFDLADPPGEVLDLRRDALQPVATEGERLQPPQLGALQRDLLEAVAAQVEHLQLQRAELFGQRELVEPVVLGDERPQPGQVGDALADGRQCVVADVHELQVAQYAERRGQRRQPVVVHVQLPRLALPLVAELVDVQRAEAQAGKVEHAVADDGSRPFVNLHFRFFFFFPQTNSV